MYLAEYAKYFLFKMRIQLYARYAYIASIFFLTIFSSGELYNENPFNFSCFYLFIFSLLVVYFSLFLDVLFCLYIDKCIRSFPNLKYSFMLNVFPFNRGKTSFCPMSCFANNLKILKSNMVYGWYFSSSDSSLGC